MTESNLPSIFSRCSSLRPRRRQRGMTLVEWMTAIAIGLILLAGLAALIAQQSKTQGELDKSSRQIENGRYAMQLLQDDIQLAGFHGEYSLGLPTPSLSEVPPRVPSPCALATGPATDPDVIANDFAVQGYDSPAVLPANLSDPVGSGGCGLNAANYVTGTDILVVRRTDTDVADPAHLKAGEIYFQSGLKANKEMGYVIAAATSTAADTAVFNLKNKDGTFATNRLRKYLVHIYFISPCSVPANGSTCSAGNDDDGGTSVPTLKRLELIAESGAAKFKVSALVEGIENLQIDYGVDLDGDGGPEAFVKDVPDAGPPAVAITDWVNVMAVRVNLLARSNEPALGTGTKTFTLGLEAPFTPAGGYKRNVFSQLVRLTNPSSRRER